jgi:hypothetical protein
MTKALESVKNSFLYNWISKWYNKYTNIQAMATKRDGNATVT